MNYTLDVSRSSSSVCKLDNVSTFCCGLSKKPIIQHLINNFRVNF